MEEVFAQYRCIARGLMLLSLLASPWARAEPTALAANTLFAFGKATLSSDGQHQLDQYAASLQGQDYDILTVTGHTDRIGALVYNMKLSERRAQAVSSYLIQQAGIPESKVLSRGQAGANAVTKPGECVGNKATRALIACLQPDRRVDLEVIGTR
jgi:OOP family OmpA-OmpF porin